MPSEVSYVFAGLLTFFSIAPEIIFTAFAHKYDDDTEICLADTVMSFISCGLIAIFLFIIYNRKAASESGLAIKLHGLFQISNMADIILGGLCLAAEPHMAYFARVFTIVDIVLCIMKGYIAVTLIRDLTGTPLAATATASPSAT